MAQLSKALFSSAKEDWETPQDFFDVLDREFHFTLDPCADDKNAKCKTYFTKEENGLSKDWGGAIQFFAIRHTGAHQRGNGSKSAIRKRRSRERWLSHSYRRGQTQSIFTNTYTTKRKFGS